MLSTPTQHLPQCVRNYRVLCLYHSYISLFVSSLCGCLKNTFTTSMPRPLRTSNMSSQSRHWLFRLSLLGSIFRCHSAYASFNSLESSVVDMAVSCSGFSLKSYCCIFTISEFTDDVAARVLWQDPSDDDSVVVIAQQTESLWQCLRLQSPHGKVLPC